MTQITQETLDARAQILAKFSSLVETIKNRSESYFILTKDFEVLKSRIMLCFDILAEKGNPHAKFSRLDEVYKETRSSFFDLLRRIVASSANNNIPHALTHLTSEMDASIYVFFKNLLIDELNVQCSNIKIAQLVDHLINGEKGQQNNGLILDNRTISLLKDNSNYFRFIFLAPTEIQEKQENTTKAWDALCLEICLEPKLLEKPETLEYLGHLIKRLSAPDYFSKLRELVNLYDTYQSKESTLRKHLDTVEKNSSGGVKRSIEVCRRQLGVIHLRVAENNFSLASLHKSTREIGDLISNFSEYQALIFRAKNALDFLEENTVGTADLLSRYRIELNKFPEEVHGNLEVLRNQKEAVAKLNINLDSSTFLKEVKEAIECFLTSQDSLLSKEETVYKQAQRRLEGLITLRTGPEGKKLFLVQEKALIEELIRKTREGLKERKERLSKIGLGDLRHFNKHVPGFQKLQMALDDFVHKEKVLDHALSVLEKSPHPNTSRELKEALKSDLKLQSSFKAMIEDILLKADRTPHFPNFLRNALKWAAIKQQPNSVLYPWLTELKKFLNRFLPKLSRESILKVIAESLYRYSIDGPLDLEYLWFYGIYWNFDLNEGDRSYVKEYIKKLMEKSNPIETNFGFFLNDLWLRGKVRLEKTDRLGIALDLLLDRFSLSKKFLNLFQVLEQPKTSLNNEVNFLKKLHKLERKYGSFSLFGDTIDLSKDLEPLTRLLSCLTTLLDKLEESTSKPYSSFMFFYTEKQKKEIMALLYDLKKISIGENNLKDKALCFLEEYQKIMNQPVWRSFLIRAIVTVYDFLAHCLGFSVTVITENRESAEAIKKQLCDIQKEMTQLKEKITPYLAPFFDKQIDAPLPVIGS